ncbi:MAG: acyl-CoA dehydrogenase family protein [Sulfuricaulis sp.]|nr:acyl-CoA dehydrogenase family protein [Sulfuricaulis sp.]
MEFFNFSPKVKQLQVQVRDFMDQHILPANKQWIADVEEGMHPPRMLEDLKAKAKAQGLWNMFLPALRDDEPGTRLSNFEYAPIAEITGAVIWAAEVFNCSSPDSGNMELLHLFSTPDQRGKWLNPLLEGNIRSAFSMTEPDVASSDATNIATTIRRDGDDYVVNGRKWFITNGADPRCKLHIVMGVTNPDAAAHERQSMLIVPTDTPGITMVRPMKVMNHLTPYGHAEVLYRNVRVPRANLLGPEGGGFMMSQARLGPGRIHHCMRSIGACEMALTLMCQRAQERKTFGKYLYEHANVAEWIALSRCEIEQARMLVLKAAWMIDNGGAKGAASEISMIKIIAARLHTTVLDRAMQTFGAMGLSQDTPLARLWTVGRALRVADGPDEVHLRSVARNEIRRSKANRGKAAAYLT